MPDDMGSFRVDVEIENPLRPGQRNVLHSVLIDTGAELSWFPARLLESLGIERRKVWRFRQADGSVLERWVGLTAMRQTPRGAWVRDLTVGTGAEVGAGTQVAIHYVGTLPDGKQFDANGSTDQPFVFRINAGEVVPGFDEGVLGMKVGGRRQVIIPPALGYGAQGNGPIPGNSILVFTIELVRVQ